MARRIKTKAIDAPANQADAEAMLADIGHLQRQVAGIENLMNDELATIKTQFEQKAQPLNSEIESKFQALHVWAEAHRAELLKGRAKTAKLASGEIAWRRTPKKVSIRGVDRVLETLKRLNLADLIRTKEEINKEAILDEPERIEGIAGISISQREEFIIKPFESEIEKVVTVK